MQLIDAIADTVDTVDRHLTPVTADFIDFIDTAQSTRNAGSACSIWPTTCCRRDADAARSFGVDSRRFWSRPCRHLWRRCTGAGHVVPTCYCIIAVHAILTNFYSIDSDADADELYRGKISRLLTIWQERQVFDEAFVNALRTAAGLKAVNGNGNDVAAVQTPAGESKVATSSPSPRSREKEASSTVAISLPPLYNEIAEQLLRINRASIEVNQLLEQCEQAAPGNGNMFAMGKSHTG